MLQDEICLKVECCVCGAPNFLDEIKIKATSATSGARPVAGGLGPPRYGTSCYRVGLGFTDINTSCKPPVGVKPHIVNPRRLLYCWLAPVVFSPPLLEGFSTLNLVSPFG